MRDRDHFLRPIAHRGLHNAKRGIVENTMPAFDAALRKGYAIECDLRPAAGGLPLVFHDETLNRLVAGRGPVARVTASDLKHLTYRDGKTRLTTFADLLDRVDAVVPLVVEIKSEWAPPDKRFLTQIATLAQAYKGPLALMSFDPAIMTAMKNLAPRVPRGIISGSYRGAGWWNRKISRARAARLRNLLESGETDPAFYAYQVGALPTPVTEYVRTVLNIPVLTWTVRSAKDRAAAAKWADAPIFEGFEP